MTAGLAAISIVADDVDNIEAKDIQNEISGEEYSSPAFDGSMGSVVAVAFGLRKDCL